MKQASSNEEVMDIRGRIYARNPSYERCRTSSDGSAFKALLRLADEGVMASTRLAQMLQAGHPLQPSLSGMNSAEAMTYLLGITQKYIQQGFSFPSDKLAMPSSDQVLQQLIVQRVEPPKTDPAAVGGEISSEKSLELDDETFDAFSNFSVTTG